MKKLIFLLTWLGLSGCAVCRDHPMMCQIGTVVVVGSIAVAVNSHQSSSRTSPSMVGVRPPVCSGGACQ